MDERLVDLSELLVLEVEQLRALAERKGLRIEMRQYPQMTVQADESLLRQAIRNLISNAVKFTPPSGWIKIECAPMATCSAAEEGWPGYTDVGPGAWVGLRVVDSGIGIAAEHLSRLFDRFYRVENQMGVPGTGLGLAITRELVTRHGGWMGVASEPGEGSVFAFYLPLASADG
jgi:signal transduction histidine kinase